MRVHVLFFASLRELARTSSCDVTVDDGATVADLWRTLCTSNPALEPMGASLSFAVNQEYTDRDHHLADGDEVALIPPVSGGCCVETDADAW